MVEDGEAGGVARAAVLLAAAHIQHDGYVLGHGVRLPDGTVSINGHEVGGLDPRIDEAFVRAYAPLAGLDLAAQAFASRVSPVLRIPIDHYRTLGRKTGYKLLDFFKTRGVEHLLLAGVESTYGLAWLTLYRTGDDKRPAPQPFGLGDCETAMYSIRGALYTWQRAFMPVSNEDYWGDFRFDLIQLSPAVLETAIWRARGLEYMEIARQLGITKDAVRKHLDKAEEELGMSKDEVSRLLLARMMGPLPAPRSRRLDREGESRN